MRPPGPFPTVDPAARLQKKLREARLLRDVSPEDSLEMGFQMIRFARRLAEATDRARV